MHSTLHFPACRPTVTVHFRCDALRQTFGFFDQALSDEERDYPLAYGMLVHDHASQVSFMLSAIYQPQNAYCIAVDGKSSAEFKDRMDLLADCFPNIFVMVNRLNSLIIFMCLSAHRKS